MTYFIFLAILIGLNLFLLYLFIRTSSDIADIKKAIDIKQLEAAMLKFEQGRIYEHTEKKEIALEKYLESLATLNLYKKYCISKDLQKVEVFEKSIKRQISDLGGTLPNQLFY